MTVFSNISQGELIQVVSIILILGYLIFKMVNKD
ncbi:hypothetical protein HIMB114_00012980 [alpha proteobacterium HIMB114]|nr:hypothetical protein HIMB114_00012980 [alpha proteobacterium HIMB114]